MSVPTGFTAGLAFLPNWLNDAKDAVAFDAILSAWVRASGWRSAGVVWPADVKPTLAMHVRPDGATESTAPPPELPEPLKALRGGSQTVVWQLPNTCGRLYALLQPAGRPAGVLWVERAGPEPWSETDRHYLLLSVRLIERSPALAAKIGPLIDSERLQQRLNDAAVIAGRMAHDFDNVLTGIIGFADLTVPLVPANSQPAKFVAEIGKVGQRGIVFTQQLHQLSRAGQVKPLPGGVAAAVAKEEVRLRPAMPPGLQLVTDIPASLAAVGMDNGPLGVVLGHLIENAADASPPNGRVAVTARAVELSVSDAKTYLGRVGPGTHIEVTVQDYGTGIKPEIRAKLFAEPFFTTKVRHRGLGLAVAYRTLYAHHGGIRIEPATPPEVGTTVRVVIPPGAVRPPVATAPPRTTTATATTLGG
jgi:signal transduction histidine kinase